MALVDAADPVDAVLAVELPDVPDDAVVDETTSPLAFVTVVVTTPPGPCVTVVVSPEEEDDAVEAVEAAGATDVAGAVEAVDCVAEADPVAPGVAIGEPRAAMALLRLALIVMIHTPNPSGFTMISCSARA